MSKSRYPKWFTMVDRGGHWHSGNPCSCGYRFCRGCGLLLMRGFGLCNGCGGHATPVTMGEAKLLSAALSGSLGIAHVA